MTAGDPYKILQVDPEAEFEVIEAAYRRLARKYHPDLSDSPEARDRMVAINRAWDELRTPERRAAVDRARARAAVRATPTATSPAAPPRPAHRSAPAPSTPGDGSLRAAAQPPSSDNLRSDRAARGGHHAGGAAQSGAEEWAGPPPGNPSGSVLGFGRYRDWSLGEVARRDISYIEWLERSPTGRAYRAELDAILRTRGRRGRA